MVLLFYPSAEKTSERYIGYARPYLCLRRNSFLISRFLFLSLMSLLFFFLMALRVTHSLSLIACRLLPIALFHRSFSESLQKRIYGSVFSLSARRLLPSINPRYLGLPNALISMWVHWLDFSLSDRFAALSMTPLPRRRMNSMPSIHHDAMQCLRNSVLILLCAKNQWVSAFRLPICQPACVPIMCAIDCKTCG